MNKPLGPNEQRSEAKPPLTLVPPPAPARSRKRTAWAIGGLAALVVLIAIGAVWWLSSAGGNIRYTTAAVTRGPVTRAVVATGIVNPVLTIIVGSYVSGTIQDVTCDYNTKVKKGEVCATIDPRPYQSVVDQTEGQFGGGRRPSSKRTRPISATRKQTTTATSGWR